MHALKKLLQKKEVCHPMLALLLFLVLFLRLPNFFEPYWYGDEAIYLTIGNGLRMGQRLYVDIVDHKTPLIYYFASVGNQLNFRILLVTWMLVTTIAFYRFSERIFKNKWSTYLATLLFVLFTSLPLFEGNIPNGELFVMGFVIFGFWMLSYTKYFTDLLQTDHDKPKYNSYKLLILSGALFGLGILTKVPGLLDAGAALSIGWFTLLQKTREFSLKAVLQKKLPRTALQMGVLFIGVVLPIILSIVYYVLRGSGEAYLNFGLLYNFHYSGNWDLGFTNPLLIFYFTLPGKFLVVVTGILLASALTKYLSPQFQFVFTWTLLALFASLLSNRPYPHYFLQVFPPLTLLAGFVIEKYKLVSRVLVISLVLSSFVLVLAVFKFMNLGGYSVTAYYERSYNYLSGKISYVEYRNAFDGLMADNYSAAQIITKSNDPYMFIWGTNPTLYALSKKQPTGRFTVAFHVADLNVYEETFISVREKQPEFIVVMKDVPWELPGLHMYLKQNYIANNSFDHFVLWRKRSSSSL